VQPRDVIVEDQTSTKPGIEHRRAHDRFALLGRSAASLYLFRVRAAINPAPTCAAVYTIKSNLAFRNLDKLGTGRGTCDE
jgi:hypothetical protein